MEVQIPFEPGDKIIVLRDGKFSVETFNGNFKYRRTAEGEVIQIEIDRIEPGYSSINMSYELSECYRSVDEAIMKSGLADITSDMLKPNTEK